MTRREYNAIMQGVKTWDEWLLLSVTLWAEARGESEKGKIAVAFVMKHRQESKQLWDDVLAPWQFSCWNYYPKTQTVDPNFHKMFTIDMYKDKSFQVCVRIITQVLYGNIENPFPGADHYFAKGYPYPHGEVPDWAMNMKKLGEEGRHIFMNSNLV
jgi:spore germination cell wall hydrolase CwlJ-like protein